MRNRNVWKSKQITTPSRRAYPRPLLPPPLYKHITYTQHISSLCYLHSEHHFDQKISFAIWERKKKSPMFEILFWRSLFLILFIHLHFLERNLFNFRTAVVWIYHSSICKSCENADRYIELGMLLEKKISTH